MRKSLLFIFALVIVAAGIQSCHKSDNNVDKVKAVYNVSGLFSITGNWSTLGMTSRAALNIAVNDINAYLKNKNADFRMSVDFYDTKLDPALATQAFIKSASTNTHFIIGPQSSAELAAIIPKADSANVIVVSQGSTAGSLALKDPVFRFCPPDHIEGAAIAKTIYNSGIRGLVTVARNDAGNLGLQTATGNTFTGLGGHISALDAYSTTITDFSTEVTLLHNQVQTFVNTYGADKVGIYLSSFDECTALFKAAAGDALLKSVPWYGGDGVVLSTVLTADAAASDFAIATHFFAPNFGLPEALKSKWQPIANNIQSITGIAPDAFALAAYDAMWVITHTIEAEEGKNASFAQLTAAFEAQADGYTGITGSTELDAFGDRDSGTFDYYGIAKTGSNYNWILVGESE